MVQFDTLICKYLHSSKCKRWILLIFTAFDTNISNIKYTEFQRNQNKFNQSYNTLLIHNFIDDKRKTLALFARYKPVGAAFKNSHQLPDKLP